jgi:hypothetical protein
LISSPLTHPTASAFDALAAPAGEIAVVEHIIVLIRFVNLILILVFFEDPLVKGLVKF